MARFRFSMQSLLDVKLKLENQVKQEFSAARAALDREEEKLDTLKTRKADYEAEAVRLLQGDTTQNTLDLMAIKDSRAAILNMEQQIEEQKKKVAAAERNLERIRARLADAMTERKTLDRLRDKAFEEYLAEEKRSESKEVDELTSYVYGQHKNEDAVG